jgi:hypothetical protein
MTVSKNHLLAGLPKGIREWASEQFDAHEGRFANARASGKGASRRAGPGRGRGPEPAREPTNLALSAGTTDCSDRVRRGLTQNCGKEGGGDWPDSRPGRPYYWPPRSCSSGSAFPEGTGNNFRAGSTFFRNSASPRQGFLRLE